MTSGSENRIDDTMNATALVANGGGRIPERRHQLGFGADGVRANLLGIGVAGVVLGAIAGIFSTPHDPAVDYGAIIGMSGSALGSVYLAVRSRTYPKFLLRTVTLWAGFAGACAAFTGNSMELEIIPVLGAYALAASMVGIGIKAISDSTRENSQTVRRSMFSR